MNDRIKVFEDHLVRYTPEEKAKIMEAATWADSMHRDQLRASGEPYIIHPLHVAEFLIDMKMDAPTIIAALLHDILEDTDVDKAELEERFGDEIVQLVDGVTKISILKAKNKSVQEAETIRKMLFAMIKDIRVIIIKLADKFHNMSTLEHLPANRRKAIATECLDVYAPLAGRLGISWLKAELEDLALKALNPGAYYQIKDSLIAKRSERAEYLHRMKNAILEKARSENLDIHISTRAKHFYSIFRKMKKRKKKFDEIFDLLGIRILCDSDNDCYTILGLVHRLWPPIEGRFKDYIAMPKANQYQSLHTTVMSYEGRLIEIQIRTKQMHETAEFGVAAHWAYKNSLGKEKPKVEELGIINKLKTWDDQPLNSGEFLEEIKRDLLKDTIFVFTPKGHIIELPKSSTAIDFAYHIHTEVGHHCAMAKADGSIIPLNAPLKNTQVIEIITSNNAHPHVNWLKYVHTASARSKIRHWLNQHDDSVVVEKNVIARNKKVEPPREIPTETDQTGSGEETEQIITEVSDSSKIVFRIGNEKNMMISLAGCCNPSIGDDIIGYISRGRGIIVHKTSCPNIKHINDFDNRHIQVEWEALSPRSTKRIRVTAKRTGDLFAEIEGAIKKYKGHLIQGKLEENEKGNLTGSFTMELEKEKNLSPVLKSIRTVPSVLNIQVLD